MNKFIKAIEGQTGPVFDFSKELSVTLDVKHILSAFNQTKDDYHRVYVVTPSSDKGIAISAFASAKHAEEFLEAISYAQNTYYQSIASKNTDTDTLIEGRINFVQSRLLDFLRKELSSTRKELLSQVTNSTMIVKGDMDKVSAKLREFSNILDQAKCPPFDPDWSPLKYQE
jgi:hypothetical protein